eukprot:TRINITY_DN13058_c0_g3_i1.p1 TRINITY_DN13058_c0_g3~~TRINITY_DN13058_c0_g3_i1.p1  ORF type:complete len:335 (-),score=52.18 TRINITY_DN13058_c0_g3_i1:51-1055(-)
MHVQALVTLIACGYVALGFRNAFRTDSAKSKKIKEKRVNADGYVLAILVDRTDAIITTLSPNSATSAWTVAQPPEPESGAKSKKKSQPQIMPCVSRDGVVNTNLPCKIRGDHNPPKNQGKGGQSAPRFQRKYINAKNKWTDYVVDVTMHELYELLGNRPAGILVAGNAEVPKSVTAELQGNTLPGNVHVASKALPIKAIAFHDLKEALQKDGDLAKELNGMVVDQQPSTQVVKTFNEKLANSLALVSECEVRKAMEFGVIETLMLCADQKVDPALLERMKDESDGTIIQIDPTLSMAHATWCRNYGIGAVLWDWALEPYPDSSEAPWLGDCTYA